MGDNEVEQFLSYLVNQHNVAPNTQSQALNALCFLYKDIINVSLSVSLDFVKSKRHTKLPVVLTQDETTLLFKHCPVKHYVPCAMLYGSGLLNNWTPINNLSRQALKLLFSFILLISECPR